MVDTDVDSILREIRERVYAEQQQLAAVSHGAHEAGGNDVPVMSNGPHPPQPAEALARIEGHLTTTARAWDRLPPLVSNRSGGLARLELWIKRRLKRATRWYAWEQVNFNAAVHHALSDMLEALSGFERQLQRIQTDIETWAKEFEQKRAELQAQRVEIESLRAETKSQRVEIESLRAESESQGKLGQAQILELAQELRNRDERLLDEQRVCSKQLSLEIGELNTLVDRARRQIESRLDKLETVNSE